MPGAMEMLVNRELLRKNGDLTARLARAENENALLRKSLADARAKCDAAERSAKTWRDLFDDAVSRLPRPSRAAAAESRASLEERYSRLKSPRERAEFRRKYGKQLGLLGRR